MKKSTKGELTFGMMMSGEAGLAVGYNIPFSFYLLIIGKKFDISFLTKTTAAPGRFL